MGVGEWGEFVTLLWSEIMGGYNTPCRHNGRDKSVKVGHEIR